MTEVNECTPIPGQLEQLEKPKPKTCCVTRKKWCGLTWCSFLNWLVLLGLTGLVFVLWFWVLTNPTIIHKHEHITQDIHKHVTEQHNHHKHIQEHKHITEVTEVHEHHTHPTKIIEHPMEPHTHPLPEHDHPLKPHTHPDLECRIRRLEKMAHTHRYCR